ncbi:MAG: class I tRNA ligase family protein [Nanoarchaeota archaeon]
MKKETKMNLGKELKKLESSIECRKGTKFPLTSQPSLNKKTEYKEDEKTDFAGIEKKWQKEWEAKEIFKTNENSKKQKCYVLEMYPYPSASFLHMGHVRNFTIGDVYARFKRMSGFNVLYPMGFDSFGLPAETAAKKEGIHPKQYTENSIKKITEYFRALGNSYDWSRTLASHEPQYYKWNQYFFLKLFEKGLAYRKKAPVNWCEKCGSVLANEEAEGGKCWRCGEEVTIREMEQWFFKITAYADRLLNDLEGIQWSDKIKTMQRNWIGKSHGTEVEFEIEDKNISNVIIVHGSNSSENEAKKGKLENERHWKPWLKRELEKRKILVSNELYPQDWAPNYEDWKKNFEKNKINEDTILVGHSAGGGFLVRWLEETQRKIKKLILVSPGKSGKARLETRAKLYGDRKIYDIAKYVSDGILIFTSNNDTNLHIEGAREYGKELPAKLIELEGRGHFTFGDMKTEEFPELLEEILYQKWPVFTTRPDTLYGVTFMVIAAQHPKLMELVPKHNREEVEKFVERCKKARTPEEVESLDKDGVFTGSFAINPVTKEKVPVWAGNFVVADYGSGMVMAVPTHDQRDFEFAKKYKIPMKQVIAPLFSNTFDKDAFRADKKTEERDSVFIIVKHWKDDKYFCLNWKEHKWKSFLMGGIEKGETPEQAALREMKEETGYQDIKSIKQIGFEVHARFYAGHKDVNRYGKYKTFVIELKSDKYKKPSQEETKNHDGLWIEKDKIANFLNLENHKYAWNIFLNGEQAYTSEGILINSWKFNGMESKKAIEEITKHLEDLKLGRKTTNYKIRDWMISRQRYWGTPIPIIYCDKCGVVPVAEKELPVLLPEKVDFKVAGNPITTNKEFVNTKCPKCSGKATRETDTMGGFVDSSWYFLRYCDSHNDKKPFDEKKIDYWMPVDQYVGGAEHAVMHLIYARFFTKVLRDLGYVNFDEPFTKLFNQGIVYKDGAKMSKSKGNVIFQTEISDKYGIDTARLFLMFVSSPDKQMEWSDEGVEGSFRIINKIIRLAKKITDKTTPAQDNKINAAIKKVNSALETFEYPKAIISIVECIDSFVEDINKENYEILLKLIHPFCPHITEELWHEIGHKTFLSLESWPVADESKIDIKLEQAEKNADKVVSDVLNVLNIIKEKTGKEGNKIYLYVIPNELGNYSADAIAKRTGKEVQIFAVNDKNKYDPEGKSSKAKPGKPGIFIA